MNFNFSPLRPQLVETWELSGQTFDWVQNNFPQLSQHVTEKIDRIIVNVDSRSVVMEEPRTFTVNFVTEHQIVRCKVTAYRNVEWQQLSDSEAMEFMMTEAKNTMRMFIEGYPLFQDFENVVLRLCRW